MDKDMWLIGYIYLCNCVGKFGFNKPFINNIHVRLLSFHKLCNIAIKMLFYVKKKIMQTDLSNVAYVGVKSICVYNICI